jgi:hypothetical protein
MRQGEPAIDWFCLNGMDANVGWAKRARKIIRGRHPADANHDRDTGPLAEGRDAALSRHFALNNELGRIVPGAQAVC